MNFTSNPSFSVDHVPFSLSLSLFFFFWPHLTACGILVPRPGIEPMPPAVEVWGPNHWTAREVPVLFSSPSLPTPHTKESIRGELFPPLFPSPRTQPGSHVRNGHSCLHSPSEADHEDAGGRFHSCYRVFPKGLKVFPLNTRLGGFLGNNVLLTKEMKFNVFQQLLLGLAECT